MNRTLSRTRSVNFLTKFDEQDDLVIPEDLSGLSVEDLDALETSAVEAAQALAEAGNLNAEVVETLTALRDGVAAIREERAGREAAEAEVSEQAAALLADIVPAEEVETPAEPEAETPEEPEAAADPEEEPEALAASGRREVRIAPSLLRSRRPARQEAETETRRGIEQFARAAADVGNLSNGQALDYLGMAEAVTARLKGYNHDTYERAARRGESLQQSFGTIVIDKPVDENLVVDERDSIDRVGEVFAHAADESRLEGGTLLASGGWCAPSETLYDLYDQGESTEGMISLPEVTIRRGGIRFPLPVDFATVFGQIGWSYTEAQDQAGTYGVTNGVGNGNAGTKPCFVVDCPDFDEERLDAVGLCIQAGLLQRVGYPEAIAQTVQKALVAHAHVLNARKINALAAGSTPVTLPATQQGAAAPVLTAIELQVEHYRYAHLLNHNTTLEAVFPFWIHGAIRSDLSRRLGLAEFDVSDQRINAWFAQRGVRPQFVYDWQNIGASGASGFTAWPTTVSFLLYKAGTWTVGGADVLTLNTMYDSTLLSHNDYTALWTEEGFLVAKRGLDSRLVTTSIVADGATHIGVDISRTGV